MDPGQIYEVEVDLWSTSYVWNTGHRIRVAVSSSNYPRFLANPNTKDGIYQNTDYNVAENTVYIDSDNPSCIILPRYNDNYAPDKPIITGPATGLPGVNYTFKFQTIDPEGEDVYYKVDWADGANTDWIGPYSSGEEISLDHYWTTRKVYSIKAKAKDINNDESGWSYHNINVPKEKMIGNTILFRILELFPKLLSILQQILL
jgi:hypothetical protein